MRDTDLLQLARGLVPPWMVKATNFDAEARRLDIEIDFTKGRRCPCPHCAKTDTGQGHTTPKHRASPYANGRPASRSEATSCSSCF